MPKTYASVDTETTGLNPDSCQILELGIVLDDWLRPINELPVFHCYVLHELYVGEPFALQMNAEILKIISAKDKHPEFKFIPFDEVSYAMRDFFSENGINPSRIPVAGKNFAGFDRQFLRRLPGSEVVQWNQRVYDPGMLFWKPQEDDSPPDTKKCMKRAGIEGEVAHTAVADALVVVQLVREAAKRLGYPI